MPTDEEAKRAIAVFTVQKARSRGEFDEDDEASRKLRAKAQQQEEATLEQKLLQKIQQEPRIWPTTWRFPKSTSTMSVKGVRRRAGQGV